MNWKTRFLAVAMGAAGAVVMAQDSGTSSQSTSQQTTTTTTRTVSGSVVQYTPGKTIVVQDADGKTTTYTIGSSVTVPSEVQVGKKVTIYSQPSPDGSGSAVVTRVETTTVSPQGSFGSANPPSSMSSSSSTSSLRPSDQSASPSNPSASQQSQTTEQRSETTTTTSGISGKVTAYQVGKSITVNEPGKGPVVYVIDTQSDLPKDVAVGQTVTITTRTVQGSSRPVVRTVTTKTVKTTTESQPQ